MKRLLLVPAMAALMTTVAFASSPSPSAIGSVKVLVEALAEDPSSKTRASALKEELARFVADHGIEGLGSLALEEPILMQALVLSSSISFESLVKGLIIPARSSSEVEERLAALITAQLAVGQNPGSIESRSIVMKSIESTGLSLPASQSELMIDNAIVAARAFRDASPEAPTLQPAREAVESVADTLIIEAGKQEIVISRVQ